MRYLGVSDGNMQEGSPAVTSTSPSAVGQSVWHQGGDQEHELVLSHSKGL